MPLCAIHICARRTQLLCVCAWKLAYLCMFPRSNWERQTTSFDAGFSLCCLRGSFRPSARAPSSSRLTFHAPSLRDRLPLSALHFDPLEPFVTICTCSPMHPDPSVDRCCSGCLPTSCLRQLRAAKLPTAASGQHQNCQSASFTNVLQNHCRTHTPPGNNARETRTKVESGPTE